MTFTTFGLSVVLACPRCGAEHECISGPQRHECGRCRYGFRELGA